MEVLKEMKKEILVEFYLQQQQEKKSQANLAAAPKDTTLDSKESSSLETQMFLPSVVKVGSN